jgi:hypothetical protein
MCVCESWSVVVMFRKSSHGRPVFQPALNLRCESSPAFPPCILSLCTAMVLSAWDVTGPLRTARESSCRRTPTMTLIGVALGSNGLGCAPVGFFFADRRISPCLRPSLKDVRNYDTPIREQQAAVTVRYMRTDQQAAVAVEPLRLTCASSGADSAAAAAAAVAVSSASFVASTSLSAARAAASTSFLASSAAACCTL